MNQIYSESLLNSLSMSLSYDESVQCLLRNGYSYQKAIDLLDHTIKFAKLNNSLNTYSYV